MLEELVNGLEQKVAEFEKILNLNELKELLNKLNEYCHFHHEVASLYDGLATSFLQK